jgi:hypothetical protein
MSLPTDVLVGSLHPAGSMGQIGCTTATLRHGLQDGRKHSVRAETVSIGLAPGLITVGVISDTHGLYANPGSAGPRRFRLPIAVARIALSAGGIHARIVELSE